MMMPPLIIEAVGIRAWCRSQALFWAKFGMAFSGLGIASSEPCTVIWWFNLGLLLVNLRNYVRSL